MNEPPLILLTRPRADSKKLAGILQARNCRTFIEPMLTLQNLQIPAPDWNDYDGLILTSAHGLNNINTSSSIPVYCVGAATAEAARKKNFNNIAHIAPDNANLIAALENLEPAKPFLYLRGKHISTNLAYALPALRLEERITYAMQPAETLSPDCQTLMRAGDIDTALFFSRRSAEIFMRRAGNAGLRPHLRHIRALSIAQPVLECLQSASWAGLYVSETPDQDGILKKLETMLQLGTGHEQP